MIFTLDSLLLTFGPTRKAFIPGRTNHFAAGVKPFSLFSLPLQIQSTFQDTAGTGFLNFTFAFSSVR